MFSFWCVYILKEKRRNLDRSAISEVLNESDSDISICCTLDENSKSERDTCEYETENDVANEGACVVLVDA